MPAECSNCNKTYTNMQKTCSVCNSHCHTWTQQNLATPSSLPTIASVKTMNNLFLSGEKSRVHFKKQKSNPTQRSIRRKRKLLTKSQRQELTMRRGLRNLKAKKSKVVAEYGSGGARVEIHMVESSRLGGEPSFFGVKNDGSVHPRVPTDPLIPIQLRADSDNYSSSEDDSDSMATPTPTPTATAQPPNVRANASMRSKRAFSNITTAPPTASASNSTASPSPAKKARKSAPPK